MVQTGRDHVGLVIRGGVGSQAGTQQAKVRSVGQQAFVQGPALWHCAGRPEPYALVRRLCFRGVAVHGVNGANLDSQIGLGRFRRNLGWNQFWHRTSATGFARHVFRRGHLGHGVLVLETAFIDLERGGQHQDGLIRLGSHHPAHRKRMPIAHPLDVVVDRSARITTADEVGVQGMGVALSTGVARRHQRLAQDMPAKQVAKPQVQALAHKMVHTGGLQNEQIEQLLQGRSGGCHDSLAKGA